MTWDGKERRNVSELEQILRKLGDLEVGVGMLGVEVRNIQTKLNLNNGETKERLDKHEYTLYGNGKPGLTHHINRIDDIDIKVDSHILIDRWFYGIVIGLLGWILFTLYSIK